MKNVVTTRKDEVIRPPKFINNLFNHPLAGLIWIPVRVWLGYQWISASLHKLESAAWMQTGEALKGFWTSAVAIPATGTPAIHYAWYREFLQFLLNTNAYIWFAKLVAVGEFLIGITLILGIFTGFAALMGGFMNWNFMMAGSASVNPLFLVVSILLVLAWKVAGYFGADYFLIPWLASILGTKDKRYESLPTRTPEAAEA
ncbi:MAG: DoxX family protein [Anaerolineales bacterium]